MDNLENALILRAQGKLVDSNIMIHNLLKDNRESSQLNYQYAWSFDILGEELKAIPYYEKALELGLCDSDKKEAYLGLGSTYRCIGEYDKSINILKKAINEFNDNSLKVFYAMSLYNKKEYALSTEILLNLIADTSNDLSINKYKNALNFYSDKMNMIFK